MLEKQIYDLVTEDLEQHPIWYFPMDDSIEDELTVKPFYEDMPLGDFQIIIRTIFIDSEGKEYIGYIYWSTPDTIENLKPVLFVNDDSCITFWNGMIKPSWADYDVDQQEIKRWFPIVYNLVQIADLAELSGTLEGLYYLGDDDHIQYV